MENFIVIVNELGYPVAAALLGGFFMFMTLKYIMDGVIDSVTNIKNITGSLDNRIKTKFQIEFTGKTQELLCSW